MAVPESRLGRRRAAAATAPNAETRVRRDVASAVTGVPGRRHRSAGAVGPRVRPLPTLLRTVIVGPLLTLSPGRRAGVVLGPPRVDLHRHGPGLHGATTAVQLLGNVILLVRLITAERRR